MESPRLQLSWLPIVWGEGQGADEAYYTRVSLISTFLMVLVSGVFGQGLSGSLTDNEAAIAASQVVILYPSLGIL